MLAISMGAMLGSGIFVLPGLAMGKIGSGLFLAYLLSGLIVLPAALCKSEMATALPASGGTYLYVDRSLGPLAGTVVGLGTWFSLVFKSAFALVGLGAYCALLFEHGNPVPLALVLCAGLVLLNLVGVKKSTAAQNVVVALAVSGLILLSVFLLPSVEVARFQDLGERLGPGSLLGTAGFVFVSFAGVTKICSVAEEVRDPSRNLPRAILLSLGSVLLVYCVVSLVLAGVVDAEFFEDELTRDTPLASVAGHLHGGVAQGVVAVLAVLTLSSMANAGLLTSSRYPLAMSRDRLLPALFSRIGERFRTPTPAILLTGGVMFTLIATVPVIDLAKLASAFQLLVFCLVNLTVILVRESGARWYKPTFRVPLYPLTPLLGVVGTLALLTGMGREALVGAAGIIVSGVAWYYLYARRRVTRQGAVARLYGERRRISVRHPRPQPEAGVTVAVFDNDEDLEMLVPLASMLADPGCQLKVLRIEEIPDQLGLGDVQDEDPRTARIAEHVQRVAEELDEEVAFEDVVTHHAKHVLYERAVTERTNWIVWSWPARSAWRAFVPDPVAWFHHHPPCNLLAFRERPGREPSDQGLERFQKVLVLAEPGPHDSLVVHVASRLAHSGGGSLTFAYLLPPQPEPAALSAVHAYHTVMTELSDHPLGPPRIVAAEDERAGLLEVAGEFDLLILGAPPQREVRGALRGSFEDRVTDRAPCAVLRVKAVSHAPHSSLSRPNEPRNRASSGGLPTLQMPALNEFLDDVVLGVEVRSQSALFALFRERFSARLGRELPDDFDAVLLERERRQPTALGRGVAIPHTHVDGLERTHISLWVLAEGVEFSAPDGEPVDVVVVMFGPTRARHVHLHLLAQVSQLCLQDAFLEGLRGASSEAEARALIAASQRDPG